MCVNALRMVCISDQCGRVPVILALKGNGAIVYLLCEQLEVSIKQLICLHLLRK